MSDIPSGPLDAAESRAVSLLSRVILPRPGEPLDVRKLYIEESDTNSRRAHAPTRTTLGDRTRVRGVVRDLLQRVPGELLAALVDAGVGGAARRTDRLGPRRCLPVQGHRGPHHGRRRAAVEPRPTTRRRGPNSRSASTRSRTAAGSGSTSPPIPRSPSTAPRWYAPVPAPGRANIAVGIPTFNRPSDCVNALAALTSDPLVDNVIGAVIVSDQGTRKVVDHPDFAAVGRPAGQSAVDPQPAQPGRVGRLQPGHVRGAEEHRL